MSRFCLECGHENTEYEDSKLVPFYVECVECGEQTVHGTEAEWLRES